MRFENQIIISDRGRLLNILEKYPNQGLDSYIYQLQLN